MTGTDVITAILLAGIFIAVIVYLFYWLYRRSSKEVAFVRTGLGGEKVVISGGALVLPIVHNVTDVGMRTLRLEVRRGGDRALITRNRMRVDVEAEFNLRVRPEEEWVSIAAQTLGSRTLDPDQLKDLVQGRFVDALATVAAQMTMDEIQNQRGDYVKAVKELVEDAFERNGLELETVSLTKLDQTDIAQFNPSNAFDAEGLTALTEQIEARKKLRNDIEQDTMIQIRSKDLQTEIQRLEIERQSEYARLGQDRDINKQKALERGEIARDRAERERETQEAEIAAAEEIERARIRKEQAIEVERALRETTLTEEIESRRRQRNEIERETEIAILSKNREAELRSLEIQREIDFARLKKDEEVQTRRAEQTAEIARQEAQSEREAELARIAAMEAIETARVEEEKTIDTARIRSREAVQKLDIERQTTIDLQDRERMIAVLRKELERALAHAETEAARAEAAGAEEKVISVREREVAERRKLVELIEAARTAESEALQLTTIAYAQSEAAEQRAEAERYALATAKLRYETDAAGRRGLNEAENTRSEEARHDALRMKLVEHLEGIIRESVKPMEQISEIKILQVDGMPGLSGGGPGRGGGDGGTRSDLDGPQPGNGTLADNIVSSALRYRVQAPFVDELLKEIGMTSGDMVNLKNILKEEKHPPR